MSAYTTRQAFAGRVARVGDVVLLMTARHDGRPGKCLKAGQVAAISSTVDQPWICPVGSLALSNAWNFVDAQTPAEVAAMPVGSWTWRPEVGP